MTALFRKVEEPVPEAVTEIWACTNEDCNGWMRDNFTFAADNPACPLCQSYMVRDERVLPILTNYTKTTV
ncbi:hypothetical protein PRECH8_08440 [Insulibacter thermoxylanivorax]|uniref:Cold-inducible protein YdjO n=1 Tax=Insulibacter thermoxylanivorax TaxID=2749268 RepID=A0A916QEE4_9BACL|nr:cold-shock protein [Insulibacter thermoxylanivorax]GFR37548.1 hypothetical protein PRECH8_08440 [Insulibacter thermoxylanivorax]